MKKVIDLKNIKFGSLNNKYKGNFKLTDSYKTFKEEIFYNIKRGKIKPNYAITIQCAMYHDIDNIIKPIFDALQKAEIIDNDRNILSVDMFKRQIKKGKPGSLEVWIETV
jgi:Holliday junction resolvase RusA-like endonuclease